MLIIATNINSRHNKACAHERNLYTAQCVYIKRGNFFSVSFRSLRVPPWLLCVSADAAEINPRKVHEFVGNSLPEKRIDTLWASALINTSSSPCCRKNRAACLSREYNLIYYSAMTFLFNKKRLSSAHEAAAREIKILGNNGWSSISAFPTPLWTHKYIRNTRSSIHAQHPIFASALLYLLSTNFFHPAADDPACKRQYWERSKQRECRVTSL